MVVLNIYGKIGTICISSKLKLYLWNLPQNGVKSKQVKKSATLHTFALKHMGNPYLILNNEKELDYKNSSSFLIA